MSEGTNLDPRFSLQLWNKGIICKKMTVACFFVFKEVLIVRHSVDIHETNLSSINLLPINYVMRLQTLWTSASFLNKMEIVVSLCIVNVRHK